MNYNQSTLPVRVFMSLSFFHAAYEALLVNELRSTRLVDHKVSSLSLSPFLLLSRPELTRPLSFQLQYGVDIEVPGATILSTFGFHAQVRSSSTSLVSSRLSNRRAHSFSPSFSQAFWFPDVATLVGCILAFGTLSYVVLHVFVKERR